MKAACYVRVSTEDQTTEQQEQELTALCTVKGWEPVIFRDVISGGTFTRDGLDAMMKEVRRHTVKVVCVTKLDRIGRSTLHLLNFIDDLAREKVSFFCAAQGIDTTEGNAAGRLVLTVLGAIAEFERSLIRERTKSKLAMLKAKGVKLGRPCSLLQKHGDAVRACLEAGKGIRETARELRLQPGSVLRCRKLLGAALG